MNNPALPTTIEIAHALRSRCRERLGALADRVHFDDDDIRLVDRSGPSRWYVRAVRHPIEATHIWQDLVAEVEAVHPYACSPSFRAGADDLW